MKKTKMIFTILFLVLLQTTLAAETEFFINFYDKTYAKIIKVDDSRTFYHCIPVTEGVKGTDDHCDLKAVVLLTDAKKAYDDFEINYFVPVAAGGAIGGMMGLGVPVVILVTGMSTLAGPGIAAGMFVGLAVAGAIDYFDGPDLTDQEKEQISEYIFPEYITSRARGEIDREVSGEAYFQKLDNIIRTIEHMLK